MCFQSTGVKPWQKWRWAGDDIFSSVVPAARQVPGGGRFDIDIREFLSIESDAVVHREVKKFLRGHSDAEARRFAVGGQGHYDFRARCVREWVATLKYERSGRAARDWLFPAETLAHGGGDCEDLAILTVALLEATGISPSCVRVAMGYLIEHSQGRKPVRHHHAWAMYLDEGGVWQILEPLTFERRSKRTQARAAQAGPRTQVEYVPFVVFNRYHLWRVRSPRAERYEDLGEYLGDRRKFWKEFDPGFATEVHNSVYDLALRGRIDSHSLQVIKDASFWADANVLSYDPRAHFDFGYIDEGWKRVSQKLGKPDLIGFAHALHSICDFYSHSLWAHPRVNAPVKGQLPLYDAAADFSQLDWDFAPWGERPGCSHDLASAEANWKGQLISGQWWRWYSTYPNELKTPATELARRRCLPDHDALAVDSEQPGKSHLVFTKAAEYREQFRLREDAAVRHVEQAYVAARKQHGDPLLWKR